MYLKVYIAKNKFDGKKYEKENFCYINIMYYSFIGIDWLRLQA